MQKEWPPLLQAGNWDWLGMVQVLRLSPTFTKNRFITYYEMTQIWNFPLMGLMGRIFALRGWQIGVNIADRTVRQYLWLLYGMRLTVDHLKIILFLTAHNILSLFQDTCHLLSFPFLFWCMIMTQTASTFLKQQIFVASCCPYKST